MSGRRPTHWREGGAFAVLLAFTVLFARPVLAQQGMQLNYANADVRDVIRSLSTILGINVLIAEDVPSRRVTYTTPAEVPLDQLGNVLEAILESENLVLIQRGPVAQVVLAENAPATGPVRFGKELDIPPPVGLITQLVQLQFISPDETIAILRQVASPLARFETVPRSNGVLITDHSSNVARYLELIQQLDAQPSGESGLRTYVYRLKHASAVDLSATLAQVFGVQVADVAPQPRVAALSNRSLSSALESFRGREVDALAQRRATPIPELPTAAVETQTPASTAEGGLVGRITIVPDRATNSIVIRTEPPNYPVLRETIEQLDVRPPQVLLEVLVTEITLDEASQYGINWSIFADDVDGTAVTGRFGAQQFADSALRGAQDFLLRAIRLNGVDVRAVLHALETTGDVRVLSTPHVLALNNEEARILVGSQVPFSQSTRTGLDVVVDRIVQYRDVGTQLTIVPTINEDGYVTFRILQEVSSLTNQTLEAALNAPVISTREAETSAIVRDGETIVIGGLIDELDDIVTSGVPILKDIPLLGYVFKNRSTRRVRTELAIFVTPYVIVTDEDAAEVLERTRERLRDGRGNDRERGN